MRGAFINETNWEGKAADAVQCGWSVGGGVSVLTIDTYNSLMKSLSLLSPRYPRSLYQTKQ